MNRFRILDGNEGMECLECGKQLKCRRKENMKRHFRLIHKQDIDTDLPCDEEPPIGSPKAPKLTTDIDKSKFLKCCIGLIAVKDVPFRIFDEGEFFKTLISPYETKFNTNLNSGNVVTLLHSSSDTIKEAIKKTIEHKVVSLKLDIATRMDKSILGINVQYLKDYKMCINTLGMIQVHKHHKAVYLKEEILNCLGNYGIDIYQIYSITTDNGANVVTRIEDNLLKEDTDTNCLSEEMSKDLNDIENPDLEESIHADLASVMSVERCAAHTIQLAANDVLKKLHPQILACRDVVKRMRTAARSEGGSIPIPVLDNPSRWKSTYDMLKTLLNTRSYDEIEDQLVSEVDWTFISEFVATFTPLAVCTKRLQCEQYIVGDFYRDWLSCELELQDLAPTSECATLLFEAMRVRKQRLLENDAIISALYVDPRFNYINSVMLSEDQRNVAVAHLLRTFDMIKKLEVSQPKNQQTPDIQDHPSTSSSVNLDEVASSQNPYARLAQHRVSLTANKPNSRSQSRIKHKLLAMSECNMAPLDADILYFWKNNAVDDDIAKIVQVVLAVPATQVSVERAFGALSVILTKLRSKLARSTIHNLLINKLNFEVLNSDEIKVDYTTN